MKRSRTASEKKRSVTLQVQITEPEHAMLREVERMTCMNLSTWLGRQIRLDYKQLLWERAHS